MALWWETCSFCPFVFFWKELARPRVGVEAGRETLIKSARPAEAVEEIPREAAAGAGWQGGPSLRSGRQSVKMTERKEGAPDRDG